MSTFNSWLIFECNTINNTLTATLYYVSNNNTYSFQGDSSNLVGNQNVIEANNPTQNDSITINPSYMIIHNPTNSDIVWYQNILPIIVPAKNYLVTYIGVGNYTISIRQTGIQSYVTFTLNVNGNTGEIYYPTMILNVDTDTNNIYVNKGQYPLESYGGNFAPPSLPLSLYNYNYKGYVEKKINPSSTDIIVSGYVELNTNVIILFSGKNSNNNRYSLGTDFIDTTTPTYFSYFQPPNLTSGVPSFTIYWYDNNNSTYNPMYSFLVLDPNNIPATPAFINHPFSTSLPINVEGVVQDYTNPLDPTWTQIGILPTTSLEEYTISKKGYYVFTLSNVTPGDDLSPLNTNNGISSEQLNLTGMGLIVGWNPSLNFTMNNFNLTDPATNTYDGTANLNEILFYYKPSLFQTYIQFNFTLNQNYFIGPQVNYLTGIITLYNPNFPTSIYYRNNSNTLLLSAPHLSLKCCKKCGKLKRHIE